MQRKSILRGHRSHTVNVSNLNTIDPTVAVNDCVTFRAVKPSRSFIPVGESPSKMGRQDLSIGELDHSPAIVTITELREISIDGLLSHGDNSTDLL